MKKLLTAFIAGGSLLLASQFNQAHACGGDEEETETYEEAQETKAESETKKQADAKKKTGSCPTKK